MLTKLRILTEYVSNHPSFAVKVLLAIVALYRAFRDFLTADDEEKAKTL